ncbi:MAG TPA: MBL fold metallo-hydrolase [Rubricoccaceae bacterium]|jgi:phosphoribosyl 1,2-cyclic phosphate phosphodiesterase
MRLPDLLGVTATLLGTGTSTGVPIIGCRCTVCTSEDPRDARTRTSAHVVAHTAAGDVHLQIDAGPDFRVQALREGITAVDALVVTHHHFDHVVGLDDLRPFFFDNRTPAPVWALPASGVVLREMFGYVFDRAYPGSSLLDLHETDGRTPFVVQSRDGSGAAVRVTPVVGRHGRIDVMGIRIGGFAYLTDVKTVPDETIDALHGVDVLVLDGLRPESHPTHLSFAEAAEVAARVGAAETWFVHMTHAVTHAEGDALLPPGVRLAYDGLVLTA